MRGTSVMCAPERIEMPTASASSWMRRLDDLLRRLVKAGVDDLHAGVAQRPGDDLGAAIVTVEARLGDDHADGPTHTKASVATQPSAGAKATSRESRSSIEWKRCSSCAGTNSTSPGATSRSSPPEVKRAWPERT